MTRTSREKVRPQAFRRAARRPVQRDGGARRGRGIGHILLLDNARARAPATEDNFVGKGLSSLFFKSGLDPRERDPSRSPAAKKSFHQERERTDRIEEANGSVHQDQPWLIRQPCARANALALAPAEVTGKAISTKAARTEALKSRPPSASASCVPIVEGTGRAARCPRAVLPRSRASSWTGGRSASARLGLDQCLQAAAATQSARKQARLARAGKGTTRPRTGLSST